MKYPIAIEWGDEHYATGVCIPDIPGAVTAGDSPEQAYDMAVEVAHIQLEELARKGQDIPLPKSIYEHRQDSQWQGYEWGLIEIDVTPYLGKTEKVNVTLPGYIIRQIDQHVSLHGIKSRSSFLTNAALEKLHSNS